MLSEVFWVAFITTVSGIIIKCAAMAYKSKCKEIHCCCIVIIRDLEAEARAEALELQNNQQNNNQNNRLSQTINRSSSSPRVNML
jgi:hypothetical protein